MAKSIMQTKKECYLCREYANRVGIYGSLPPKQLHKHHIMHGTANRRLAEKYGVWCYLCLNHHEIGPEAVHNNADVDRHLKELAQEEFEKRYTRQFWMFTFGKNYL